MELINQIINNPQASFDPLNFIGILATVIVSFYIFKSETSISFTKERHEKLIFPLFDVLEPILYQSPDSEILSKALNIIERNKSLADGKLLSVYYYCKKNPNTESFNSLCSYIDKAFDKSCRRLQLKTRSLEYRINRNQYKSKLFLVFYTAIWAVLFIFSLISALIIFSILITAGGLFYNSANGTTQIIFTILGLVCILGLFKILEKHL
ncbi:MAG: hypothetical protein QM657_18295 [Lacrimispora sp.]|uniref:hypothetical protein n=1 Tax=Lacrimispora sp. TaxID=2719234 RepID=UPI0039E45FB7